jgi:DNA-binding transcriptional ArsR family regulator
MVKDLKKRGFLVSVGTGVYRLVERPPKQKVLQKREVMWKFLRMRKTVSAGDLQEASGVSRNYALQWLRMLERRGLTKATAKGRWMLVKDVVATPEDVEKAEKLRDLRARQKLEAASAIHKVRVCLDLMHEQLSSAKAELAKAQSWVSSFGVYAEIGE